MAVVWIFGIDVNSKCILLSSITEEVLNTLHIKHQYQIDVFEL